MQHDAVVVLQSAKARDDRFARLAELRGQLVDRRSMLTVEEMPDDRVVKRRRSICIFMRESLHKSWGFDYPASENEPQGREVRHAESS